MFERNNLFLKKENGIINMQNYKVGSIVLRKCSRLIVMALHYSVFKLKFLVELLCYDQLFNSRPTKMIFLQ